MPIYEYQCKACCHCFEELTLSANDPPAKCPECGCGKVDVSRLFQARGDSYRIGWLYSTFLQAVRLRNLTLP